MAAKKMNSLFFKCENFQDMERDAEASFAKDIAWFAQMAAKGSLMLDEIDIVLNELGNFIDQKEAEKEDAIAELQLAYAVQEKLEEKQTELTECICCRR